MNRYLLRRIAFVLLAANFLVPLVAGRLGWTSGDATTDGSPPAQVVGPAGDGRGAIGVVVPASTLDRHDADATGTPNPDIGDTAGAAPRRVSSTGPAAMAASSPAGTASPVSDHDTAADASPPPSGPGHAGAHKDKRDTAAGGDATMGRGHAADPHGGRPPVPPGHTHP